MPLRTITSRPRDLGGFDVRRILPARGHQRVGPFIFFDHFGPAEFGPRSGIDVRPHPHIGLATITYLFDGGVLHRDSLGTEQRIAPGAVNWMVAGRGIVHSERTPPDLEQVRHRSHGLQTWVALPVAHEETAPRFEHHPAESIPSVTLDGGSARVLVGSAWGVTSPVVPLSPTLYCIAELDAGSTLALPEAEERAAYVVSGEVTLGGDTASPKRATDAPDPVGSGNMLVFGPGPVTLRTTRKSRIAIIGGAPLDGPRYIWWNLVSSRRDRIAEARDAWRDDRFPPVPGDEGDRIPLPDIPLLAGERSESRSQ